MTKSPQETVAPLPAAAELDQETKDRLRAAATSLDATTVSAMLESGSEMDEATTEAAFMAVAQEIDRAEAADEALSADVPRMLHHIFDADMKHVLRGEHLRTNLTCMQPRLKGADNAGHGLGYVMDDSSMVDLPLSAGRKCDDGTCCDACSRNIFPRFASEAECDLETFPGLNTFTFNELEDVDARTILQFVRLIERVRRTIAHEYGLALWTVLPLQAYSRKYVAGTTQQGGGGGEGDFVILHTDESTHSSYHYSCVVYLNTQGVDFEGGNFVFNDPKDAAAADAASKAFMEAVDAGEAPPMSQEEEIEQGKAVRRDLTPFHPSKGAAVIFSSGWENMHEVHKLTSGTRYAVPCFFTTSPVPEQAYAQMHQGKPQSDEDIADDWLHLLLAHRAEEPIMAMGRVKELLMKWHYMCTPLDAHAHV